MTQPTSKNPDTATRILLVEDDPAYAERLRRNLGSDKFALEHATDGERALAMLQSSFFDLVITDIKMPRLSGIELLERVRSGRDRDIDRDVPVVVLSSVDDLATAVDAMRLGASDYITKDSGKSEIAMKIRRALERSRLLNENRLLRDQVERRTAAEFGEIVGMSEPIRALKEEISFIAPNAHRVLVTGETGVGKELVARALHELGPGPVAPFVDLNCAALPEENLFLSELFGHEQGAYTGATLQRRGRFELAEGGTLFLDEIGELTPQAQARVLRAIETREFTRLGGNKQLRVNCRMVFATNRNLREEVRTGNFREDLYYRINVMQLDIPPLRERRADIPLLASTFVERFCREYNRPRLLIAAEAIDRLRTYDWPGNIRELRNIMERLVIRARGDTIEADALAAVGIGPAPPPSSIVQIPDEGIDLEEVEKGLVEAALVKADWSQKEAARLLGISPDRLNARVKKFGFRHPSWRRHK